MSSADIAAISSRGRWAKKFVSLLLWDFWCENQSGMGILTFEGVSFGGYYESFFFAEASIWNMQSSVSKSYRTLMQKVCLQ